MTKTMTAWASRAAPWLMCLLSRAPLPVIRGLGKWLGLVLFAIRIPRRRVVLTNLQLCFPSLAEPARRKLGRQVFVRVIQSWLDRSWLWHSPADVVTKRLRVRGDLQSFQSEPRLIAFCPHFVGMDSGGVLITMHQWRSLCSIYSRQNNEALEAWIRRGRQRFGGLRLFPRRTGLREITEAVHRGEALYLLPDMDFGVHGAEFVPFFGQPAATVTSLSRLARLCRARVVTVTCRMTHDGYEIDFSAPWDHFPSADTFADTARMNRELQGLIEDMPEQYYWVHKRFKSRPTGEPSVY